MASLEERERNLAQVTQRLKGVCRIVGSETLVSPFCTWKDQKTREQEWCLRPGHILKQERDLGQLGWPRSDTMTRWDLGATGWGHGPL